MRNLKYAIGTVMELAGIITLAVAAIKAENERHKAVVKLLNTECELLSLELKDIALELENKHLKDQLAKHEEKEEA